jgi:hypothetical protein
MQIRHPLDEEALPKRDYKFGERLDGLIAQEAAAVSIEATIAWLTLYDASGLLKEGAIPSLLDSVLDEFDRAGLADGGCCHICRIEPVELVTYHKGRVGRICPDCLDARVQSRLAEANAKQLVPAKFVVFAAAVTFFATNAWAGIWISYELLVEFLEGKGGAPLKLLFVALTLAVVGLVAAPIGYLFRKGSRAGSRTPMIVATICTCIAIALGDLLFGSWVFSRAGDGFHPGYGWLIFVYYVQQASPFYIAIKLLAAVLAVVVANRMASPQEGQPSLLK